MKKLIYGLILPLVVISGLALANRESKDDSSKKSIAKPPSAAERAAELKKWEASPDGIRFKQWEASSAGKKVYAGVAKIRAQISAFTDMKAVVTSLSLPAGSRLGFGVMASINGVDYILRFEPEKAQLEQLYSLKVNDSIIVRSHNVSLAPKYAYPIVTGESVERNGQLIFKRAPRKGGC